MSEHAFDPTPDEQDEVLPDGLTITDGNYSATLTGDAWHGDDDSFVLWMKTAFPRAGRDDVTLLADLQNHGLMSPEATGHVVFPVAPADD